MVADRIRGASVDPAPVDGAAIRPSASIGSVVDDGSRTADHLLAAADNAMYHHKSRRQSLTSTADDQHDPLD